MTIPVPRCFSLPLLLLCWFAAAESFAAIVGTNTAATPITKKRIAMLPEPECAAWTEYLERSERQLAADQAFIANEVKSNQLQTVTAPREGRSKQWASIRRPGNWFATAEARKIADGIVSFQTPAGGWSKNFNMSEPRVPGMMFGPANVSRFTRNGDFDASKGDWNYIGTFDNEATTMQLQFLARIVAAGTNAAEVAPYRASFERGLHYILNAQMPNGGWPQVWPLTGGYHDAITFNDNAFVNVLALLASVSGPALEFAFVPTELRSRAQVAFDRGLQCLLKCQVRVDGRLTVWPQQADALTMEPTSARNFEMVSLASSESSNLTRFLMKLPTPSVELQSAIHAAAAWFEKTAIRNQAYRPVHDRGPILVSEPGHGPIWSRYYEIGSDRPIFGDRDKTIHDRVDEVSEERRVGYAWFGDSPEEALREYAKWSQRFPRKNAD